MKRKHSEPWGNIRPSDVQVLHDSKPYASECNRIDDVAGSFCHFNGCTVFCPSAVSIKKNQPKNTERPSSIWHLQNCRYIFISINVAIYIIFVYRCIVSYRFLMEFEATSSNVIWFWLLCFDTWLYWICLVESGFSWPSRCFTQVTLQNFEQRFHDTDVRAGWTQQSQLPWLECMLFCCWQWRNPGRWFPMMTFMLLVFTFLFWRLVSFSWCFWVIVQKWYPPGN